MKLCAVSLVAAALVFSSLGAATLDHHPNWKSDRLPDLYYEVLARAVDRETGLQAADGRFRSRLPAPGDDESSWRAISMQFIYAPALLYASSHPANPLCGDSKALEMALKAGDYLATCITENGEVVPLINGKPTNPLDTHRTLYCWTEAYGLLRDHLGKRRSEIWHSALKRAGEELVRDLTPRIDRPRYNSPFLGYSPNHFGLRATTIWRMGMVLEVPGWVSLTTGPVRRFTREVKPGGYWAEHDGPTMNYDYLNTTVAALNWHYTSDPAAWVAMQANTDFHLHWCTPDGVDIHTVDQRNRSHFGVSASWGLFTFCHFPEGRRFARFKLLAALGDGDDPLAALGLSALARIAQDLHYHSDGPEAPIPQEAHSYRHLLDRPAVVKKQGPWVYSISALVSPERPLSQFYLDRTAPVSLWHSSCRHIIAGGNSKGQPELATFAVRRGDSGWSSLPLDALLRGSEQADTLCVAHEGFSLRLAIHPEGASAATVWADMQATYDRSGDSCFLNLPLILHPGRELTAGNGKKYTLGREKIVLKAADCGGKLTHNGWTVSLPPDARFVWPFYTYTPYGDVRVPENLGAAVGVLSVPLDGQADETSVRFTVESAVDR
ncbi:MAG: hypothetical protein JXQ83_13425 [Candidatus Glassbacteria bacterium]|nr:hypothetical protein [Candidatus Glassbacteria bacterium]